MRATARIIRAARRAETPCFLENPATSLLWEAGPIKQLVNQGALIHKLDFCHYGKPWRKRTQIVSWGAPANRDLGLLCEGRGGVCSRKGAPHIALTGRDVGSGQLWTRIAEPYPTKLCAKLCCHLVATHVPRSFPTRSIWGFGLKGEAAV